MSELTLATALVLVAWGTLVALDLVSVPQAMIARPLVAGAVTGWIVAARNSSRGDQGFVLEMWDASTGAHIATIPAEREAAESLETRRVVEICAG